MKVVKQIIAAVWPTIYKVLAKAADKTETQFDDITVEAINAAIQEWIESDEDEDE